MFFFDIEAGGLLGSQSSILSVAAGTTQENVGALYAKPTSGSRLYRWSAENVWKPIQETVTRQRLKWRTEQQLLTELIEQLKNQQTIAGWNIGYHAAPIRYKEELRGFDLPTIATRAAKYGLLPDLQEALRGKTIRDIGQEYAALTARVVLQNQGRVDEAIFEQAVGYQKALAGYGIDIFGDDVQDIARIASVKNVRLAGWKQETIYETIFNEQYQAHMAEADVRAGLRLAEYSPTAASEAIESNLEFWNRRTVYNKMLASARYGVGPESKAFQSMDEMWAKAAEPRYNLTQELKAGIAKMASDYGVSEDILKAGKGVGVEKWDKVVGDFRVAPGKIFSGLPSKVFATLASNKGKAALIGGVGAMALLQPGQWFSGKDDEYNTIEGLRHDGIGWQMRQALTDFGSGARNILGGTSAMLSRQMTPKQMLLAARKWRSSVGAVNASRRFIEQTKAPSIGAIVADLEAGTISKQELAERVKQIREAGLKISEESSFIKALMFSKHGLDEIHDFLPQKFTAKEKEYFMYSSLFHETSELWHGIRITQKSPDLPKKTQISSHMSTAVVADELLFSAAISDEAYRASKKYRLAELDLVKEKIAKYRQIAKSEPFDADFFLEQASALEKYVRKTNKMITSLEKKWLPRFSGFDDSYNTIEGLSEKGISPQLRKAITDFGSGYQGPDNSIKLYRGTSELVARHTGQGGLSFTSQHKQVEDIFERVRLAHYSERPSRLSSTFWTPHTEEALRFAKGAKKSVADVQGYLSRTDVVQPFFTHQEIYAQAVTYSDDIRKVEHLAHQYWKGISIEDALGSIESEVLLPGTVVPKKTWHVLPEDKLITSRVEPLPSIPSTLSPEAKARISDNIKSVSTDLEKAKSLIYTTRFSRPLKSAVPPAITTAKVIGGALGIGGLIGLMASVGAQDQNLEDTSTLLPLGLTVGGGGLTGAMFYSALKNPIITQKTSQSLSEESIKPTFKKLEKLLEQYGDPVGTGHKRIIFPEELLSQAELEKDLGFLPVKAAIPESGQTVIKSWRHTENLYHIHKHGPNWVMHLDEHIASTMALHKAKQQGSVGAGKTALYLALGIPHVALEGVPGAYYFTRGLLMDSPSMTERISSTMSKDYLEEITKLYRKRTGEKTVEIPWLKESRVGQFYDPRYMTKRLSGMQKLALGAGLTLATIGIVSLLSGNDDDHNTIEGLREEGVAGRLRKENTDFGSGYKGLIRLFRGTSELVKKHTPVFKNMKFTQEQSLVEQILERVRVAEFAQRPSRSAVTFWSPNPATAAEYAGVMGSGGFVSRTIAKQDDIFFTNQEIVTDMVKTLLKRSVPQAERKATLVQQARQYWRGVDVDQIKNTSEWKNIEALIPQEVTADKIWSSQKHFDRHRFHLKHREGLKRATGNTKRPGNRHTKQTGSVVL